MVLEAVSCAKIIIRKRCFHHNFEKYSQRDQIGLFKGLDNKFHNQSSLNILKRVSFKVKLLRLNLGKACKIFGNFLFQHLVTLAGFKNLNQTVRRAEITCLHSLVLKYIFFISKTAFLFGQLYVVMCIVFVLAKERERERY